MSVVATLPLLFLGGMVTTKGVGMSVPDWPNTYGYNMFTFPPSRWIGGIFWEHTHRLMGSIVGMLWIIVAIWAWRVERRAWVRWLAVGVLGAVIFQGVLGGLRVRQVALWLAIVHGCFAQVFLCLASFMVLVVSRWWLEAPDRSRSADSPFSRWFVRIGILSVIVICLQLILGALMRHLGAGLAIPDLPLAYGQLVPPTDAASLFQANQLRVWEMGLTNQVTLSQVWLHFGHRIGAVLVTGMIGLFFFTWLRNFKSIPGLKAPALLLPILLTAQVTLGILTVLLRKPADIATLHVVVGALVLLTTFILTVRAMRLFTPRAGLTVAESREKSEQLGFRTFAATDAGQK